MYDNRQSAEIKVEYRDLVRVLHIALREADACAGYVASAEAARNDQLADFFRDVQSTYVRVAEQAEEMLGIENTGLGLDSVRSSRIHNQGDPDPGDVSPGQDVDPSAGTTPNSPPRSAL